MRTLLIYIAIISVFAIPAIATQYELKWDDGVHNGSYWTGSYRGTTFTAPYDLEVVSFRVYWYNCSTVHTCELDVYDDDAGDPGNRMFSSPVTGTIPVGS